MFLKITVVAFKHSFDFKNFSSSLEKKLILSSILNKNYLNFDLH
jgi:hypothetical protein